MDYSLFAVDPADELSPRDAVARSKRIKLVITNLRNQMRVASIARRDYEVTLSARNRMAADPAGGLVSDLDRRTIIAKRRMAREMHGLAFALTRVMCEAIGSWRPGFRQAETGLTDREMYEICRAAGMGLREWGEM